MPFEPIKPNMKVWSKKGCQDCLKEIIVEVTVPLTDGDRNIYIQTCQPCLTILLEQFKDVSEVHDAIKNTYDSYYKSMA